MDDSQQRLTHAASSFRRYRMITKLFLGFVALMTAVVVALSARYLNGRTAFAITAGLFVLCTKGHRGSQILENRLATKLLS
jgi:hypothetical protein